MPRGDGTGPMGMGSMTGRAAGYCAGFSAPGFSSLAPRMGMGFRRGAGFYGRGIGFGRGGGRGGGFGRGFARTPSYFGRGMGFQGRAAPFAQVPYRAPFAPTYGRPGTYQYPTYRYPAYRARPAYGIW